MGPLEQFKTDVRNKEIETVIHFLYDIICYNYVSSKQISYIPRDENSSYYKCRQKENSTVIGTAVAMHLETRCKKILDLLSSKGLTVSYIRILLLETSLANAVIRRMKENGGIYVPPVLKKRTFVFFAANNSNLMEDSPDGKGTMHGTIFVAY